MKRKTFKRAWVLVLHTLLAITVTSQNNALAAYMSFIAIGVQKVTHFYCETLH